MSLVQLNVSFVGDVLSATSNGYSHVSLCYEGLNDAQIVHELQCAIYV